MGTSKKRFIELHGEEAWEIEAKKRGEKCKKYREEHAEQIAKQRKQHYQTNKEEVLEQKKRYYQDNRDIILKQRKTYHIANREKIINYNRNYYKENREHLLEDKKNYVLNHADDIKQWYQDNAEIIKAKRKERYKNNKDNEKKYQKIYVRTYYGRANRLWHNYNQNDKEHNRGECTLTPEWIIDNIFNSSCIYCGDNEWTHLGADRIDNSKPHTPDNCVCACFLCNAERANRYSVEEFKKYRQLHPRFSPDQKTWEIIEKNNIKILKKRAI